MHDFDVPDLVGALAERFSEYNIGPREAAHITLEMLREAMSAVDTESEARLELACEPTGTRH